MKEGAAVKVQLASGEWYTGQVSKILPNYTPSGEVRFEVKGHSPRPFHTITSGFSLRAASY